MPNLGRRLGRYLGSYIGSRPQGAAGVGSAAFPGLWEGVAQGDVIAWWDGQDVLQFDKSSTTGFPYPGDTIDTWTDKTSNDLDLFALAGTFPIWGPGGLDTADTSRRIQTSTNVSDFSFIHQGDPFLIATRFVCGAIGATQALATNQNGASAAVGFDIFILNTGVLRFRVTNGASAVFQLESAPLTEGVEYDVLISFNGTTASLRVDQVEVDTDTPALAFSGDALPAQAFCVLERPSNNTPFTGILRQLIILNRAATADDITRFSAWQSPAVSAFDSVAASSVAWWDAADPVFFTSSAGGYPNPGDTIDFWANKNSPADQIDVSSSPPVWDGDSADTAQRPYDLPYNAEIQSLHDKTGGTLAVSFEMDAVPATTEYLFDSNYFTSANRGVTIAVLGGGAVRVFATDVGGVVGDVATSNNVSVGSNRIVYTLDGSSLRVWLNGVLSEDTTLGVTGVGPSTFTPRISGRVQNGLARLQGEVSQIIIDSRVWAEEEVAQFAAWSSPAVR